jgi:drug/metabolite transporter (DMT)-like permease
MSTDPIPLPQGINVHTIDRRGVLLVAGSALAWSMGGMIDRFIEAPDTWTVVLWRSVWAAAFLITFLLVRDGRKAPDAFKAMGWPGLVVALCFMTASISFVQAIALTTVANVILINATVPLVAALIARIFLGEIISGATWAAIAAVIAGVAIMVSDGSGGSSSLVGNLLALLITFVFAIATVVTRRHSNVRMTPAVITATTLAAIVAATQASAFRVSGQDMSWLFAFGALNLGLGMALFVTGARLIPSALAALLGTLETVLSPVWVWLVHGEKASVMTVMGGGIVMAALVFHLIVSNRKSLPSGKM